jgi:hypothetical protein
VCQQFGLNTSNDGNHGICVTARLPLPSSRKLYEKADARTKKLIRPVRRGVARVFRRGETSLKIATPVNNLGVPTNKNSFSVFDGKPRFISKSLQEEKTSP